MLRRASYVFGALSILASVAQGGYSREHRLLVILVDGVRWDYMNDTALKGFPRIAKHGVRAEYVTPIYPSNSYPNWYSIVTGLYAENHGFVQNYMYDQQRKDLFLMSPHPNASHEHWWNRSEPIWVSAEKQGVRTAMYWWDGCQVSIHGVRPTRCHEYINFWVWNKVNEDTSNALEEILDWFQESSDHRLALLYYEGVDATGHFRGPDNLETRDVLREFDKILDKFQDKLEDKNLVSKVPSFEVTLDSVPSLDKRLTNMGFFFIVNLMVVSDHGMSESAPSKVKIIDLESYNVTDDIELMLDRGSLAMILPAEGKEDKLYNHLKNANIKGLSVFKKNEIPEKYHIKKNDLVLPLLLVADEGYFIQRLPHPQKMKPSYSRIFKGYHGYDPYKSENMRTIFYARGPAVRERQVTGPLSMVDHYNMMCKMLAIECHPNNGSWDRVSHVLNPGNALNSRSNLNAQPELLANDINASSVPYNQLWIYAIIALQMALYSLA